MEPNPGSKEAIAKGCICPVIDNHHGQGVPWRDKDGTLKTSHWVNGECQLHGHKNELTGQSKA